MTQPSASSLATDPTAMSLAGVYAEALLGLFPDNAAAEDVADELEALADMLSRTPGAAELLSTAVLGREDRQALVQRVFGSRVSPMVGNFLGVLARRDRLGLLRAAAVQFRNLLNRREGKVEVVVTSAAPLDEGQKEAISRQLRELLGQEPLLTCQVDAGLIGGMQLRVGDRVYDASVAAYLRDLKKDLLTKGAAGRCSVETES